MIANRRDIEKWIISFFSLIAGCLAIHLSENAYTHLCIVIAFVALCILYSRLNFSHPLFWFSIFFFLYACGYIMIIMMYPNDRLAIGYNKESTILILTGLGVITLCVGVSEQIYDYDKLQNPDQYKVDLIVLRLLFVIFCILLFLCVTILRIQGVTSKQIQWEERNLLWVFAAYSTRFLVFIIVLLLFMGEKKNHSKRKIIIATLLTALYSFSTGERDGLLRLIITILLAFAMLGAIKKGRLVFIGVAGFVVMILMNYLKYFFTTGTLNVDFLAKGNYWYAFLYSDFAECGSNLQTLLNHPELCGTKGFSTLFSDVLSAFIPSIVMNRLYGGTTRWNVSEWYNDYFYRGSSYNRAFTIVGEGYVIGGIFGVIVLFIVIGLLIRWMYKRSERSPYYAALYIYGAATIISSFRGDLASISQGLIRIPFMLIIIICFAKKIIRYG